MRVALEMGSHPGDKHERHAMAVGVKNCRLKSHGVISSALRLAGNRLNKFKNAAFPVFLKHKIRTNAPLILVVFLVGQTGGFSGNSADTVRFNLLP